MLDCVPILLWETDLELRFTALHGMTLRSLGLPAGEPIGRPISDLFFSKAIRADVSRAHHAALRGDAGAFQLEVNGREFHATTKPLRGPDGAIRGVTGIAIDLTERLVAERALRLSEHGYRTLIEETPYAICRSTVGGELLQVNRAMTEMLGYDAAAAPELLLLDLPLIFASPAAFTALQLTLLEVGTHPGTDSAWRHRDGHLIQVRVSGRVVRDPKGAVCYLDIFAEDITEKKRLETELGHAQRLQAIGQLAGGVAHDFNNILTVISGHVEMLLGAARDNDTRERLDEVKQSAAKAADLTRQLLAFGRRQMLQTRIFNLNSVISKLTGMLTRIIKENIELRFIPGASLATVKADPGEIERVLLNLAINAQDAMPAGGRLTIETANVRIEEQATRHPDGLRAGDYVQILVRDTGVGMDEATKARIFEPFFTTKHLTEGAGLGLAVVYGVIRQSGGYISLDSHPGLGASFRIYLPCDTSGATAARETSPLTALPGGQETILFAEDDAAIRLLISRVLEKLGYRVLSAPDGAAAFELARLHSGGIHLLLSDIVMPVLGGRELAAGLRAEKPDLKVVFISGYAGKHTNDFEVTGAHFLQKPVAMDRLANTIRAVLDGAGP